MQPPPTPPTACRVDTEGPESGFSTWAEGLGAAKLRGAGDASMEEGGWCFPPDLFLFAFQTTCHLVLPPRPRGAKTAGETSQPQACPAGWRERGSTPAQAQAGTRSNLYSTPHTVPR